MSKWRERTHIYWVFKHLSPIPSLINAYPKGKHSVRVDQDITKHEHRPRVGVVEELGDPVPQPLEGLVPPLCPEDDQSEDILQGKAPKHRPPFYLRIPNNESVVLVKIPHNQRKLGLLLIHVHAYSKF